MRLSLRSISVLSLYTFSLMTSYAAVDYSRCQAFVGSPAARGGMGVALGSPAIFGFKIKDDGSIEKEDYADIKTEDGGKTQIISYEIPNSPFMFPSGTEVKSEKMEIRYTIKRDDKGKIIEIYEGGNATTAQLERMKKQQLEFYKEHTPEEIRKHNDEFMGGEDKKYEPPFMAYKGRAIKFKFNNDKCIPSEIIGENYTEPKADGAVFSGVQMDIDLCRDVNDFLRANPEASACFRKDINDRMGMIFKKHAPKFNAETQAMMDYAGDFGGMGGYGGFGMMGGGGFSTMNSLAYSTPAMLVLGSDETFLKGLNDEGYIEMKRRISNTPIINGQRLLQSCFDYGVREIIEDESLWATGRSQRENSDKSQKAQAR